MTYYEELGVPHTASRGELRQAYTRMARSIPPDECRRLKGMLEVLLDSPARDRYDRSLTALARAVSGEPLPKNLRQRIPEWIGPTAIVAGAALLLVLLLALWPARPPGAAAPAAPVTGVAAVEPLREQAIEHDMDWEPLVTYAYSSHLPIPPLPFSEPAAMPPARDPPPSRRARATK